jgi:hypothetical protein
VLFILPHLRSICIKFYLETTVLTRLTKISSQRFYKLKAESKELANGSAPTTTSSATTPTTTPKKSRATPGTGTGSGRKRKSAAPATAPAEKGNEDPAENNGGGGRDDSESPSKKSKTAAKKRNTAATTHKAVNDADDADTEENETKDGIIKAEADKDAT